MKHCKWEKFNLILSMSFEEFFMWKKETNRRNWSSAIQKHQNHQWNDISEAFQTFLLHFQTTWKSKFVRKFNWIESTSISEASLCFHLWRTHEHDSFIITQKMNVPSLYYYSYALFTHTRTHTGTHIHTQSGKERHIHKHSLVIKQR